MISQGEESAADYDARMLSVVTDEAQGIEAGEKFQASTVEDQACHRREPFRDNMWFIHHPYTHPGGLKSFFISFSNPLRFMFVPSVWYAMASYGVVLGW